MRNQKRNMDLAAEVVRVAKIKYTQGVGSNLEVTTAEASLKESQINYFNAVYDALIAKVDQQKAVGTLYSE
jgi:outer membrane protein TolC